ncbi:MAG: tRNA pseudouridine(38-40) synthase TruA [Pirellulales bacterium]|nr:tRNA pseudouridine(38-40) synthase TruA [Pirellulales bacterium]
MSSFKLTLAYDGAEFCGWQRQPGRRTVQGELERAWRETTGEDATFAAAGRTDAGVHAAGQVASIDSPTTIPAERLADALNSRLPADMAVLTVEHAPEGFHATHDARQKTYRYTLYQGRTRPLFARGFAWHIPGALDLSAMRAAAAHLLGEQDFASFQSVGSPRESTVRTILNVSVSGAGEQGADAGDATPPVWNAALHEAPGLVAVDVTGDGFLYHMVRTIAGTLVDVGRGRREPQWVAEAIAARDRRAAGQTAPAHGLMLMRVEY